VHLLPEGSRGLCWSLGWARSLHSLAKEALSIPGHVGPGHRSAHCTAAAVTVFPLIGVNWEHWSSREQRPSKCGLISPVLAEMLGLLGDN